MTHYRITTNCNLWTITIASCWSLVIASCSDGWLRPRAGSARAHESSGCQAGCPSVGQTEIHVIANEGSRFSRNAKVDIEIHNVYCGRPVAIGLVLISLYPVNWVIEGTNGDDINLKWVHVYVSGSGSFVDGVDPYVPVKYYNGYGWNPQKFQTPLDQTLQRQYMNLTSVARAESTVSWTLYVGHCCLRTTTTSPVGGYTPVVIADEGPHVSARGIAIGTGIVLGLIFLFIITCAVVCYYCCRKTKATSRPRNPSPLGAVHGVGPAPPLTSPGEGVLAGPPVYHVPPPAPPNYHAASTDLPPSYSQVVREDARRVVPTAPKL